MIAMIRDSHPLRSRFRFLKCFDKDAYHAPVFSSEGNTICILIFLRL